MQRRIIAASNMLTGVRPPGPAIHHPRDRIDALASAGIREMGLSVCADGGRWGSWTPIREHAENSGVWISEIEVVRGWAARGGPSAASVAAETMAYEMADAFGSDHLVVVVNEPADEVAPTSEVAARLRAICDRAGDHGLRVALEFVPFGTVDTAAVALDLLERAGSANGGLLIDAWHVFRGATTFESLAEVPPERVVALQWSDAAANVSGTLRDDTLDRRLFPGEGVFDLDGLMALFDARHVDAPVSVEVLSEEVRALPLWEIAARIARSLDPSGGAITSGDRPRPRRADPNSNASVIP